MNFKLFFACLMFCFSCSVFANCPRIDQVKFGCVVILGKEYCQWSAPWYEGFTDSHAVKNETASAFIRAYWSTPNGVPLKPGYLGSTVCFYASPEGNIIELVQNKWGVEYPEAQNGSGIWSAGKWQGHAGIQCGGDPANCRFNYPK